MFQRAEASLSTLTSFLRNDQSDREAALQANWMPGQRSIDPRFHSYFIIRIIRYQMKAMPLISDHVAASCYSCATKFTAFRRRHHCRVCGQIFCHACCSIFVDGASLGKQSEIRTRTNLEHFCMMIPLQGEHDCGFALIATTTIRRNAASRGASEAEEPALALSSLPVRVSLRNLPFIHSLSFCSISGINLKVDQFQLSSASSSAGRGPALRPCRPCSAMSEWRPLRSIRTSAPATAPTPPTTTSTTAAMMMKAESPLREPREGAGGH